MNNLDAPATRSKSLETAGPRRSSNLILVLCVSSILVPGLTFLVIAPFWAFSNYRTEARGAHTTGTLVEFVLSEPASDGERTRTAVIRFVTSDGEIVEARDSNLPEAAKVGDPIALSYYPSAPKQTVVVRGARQLYFAPVALGIFGILLTGGAALGFVAVRKLSRADREARQRMANMRDDPRRRGRLR